MAPTRRLAAIMFTDMVGYTTRAHADERTALRLREEQEGLLRSVICAHAGREVKSTGDGFLVEFESALKATECAVAIQRRLHERNQREGVVPIDVRIGIHLGDVEQQGSDIFGDAVNIASRIEPVADPGGICASGAVEEQVRNKIPQKLERLPPRSFKGIPERTEIFRLVLPWTSPNRLPSVPAPIGLAVLPFANISPDPKDEYIADGLTEELIAVLAQRPRLRVIARTSVTPYRSSDKGASRIGAELGVTSILEGSVRRAGNRLRITAQLIDVETQGHLWSRSFDRELTDVLAIQVEIANQASESLRIGLPAEPLGLPATRPGLEPASYLAYLKGRTLMHRSDRSSLEEAKRQFETAISLDATNAAAHSGLSMVLMLLGFWYPSGPRWEWEVTRRRLANRALELDPSISEAHHSLAEVHWSDHQHVEAEREFQKALSLNPSDSLAHNSYGVLLEDLGRPEEALREFLLAEGADPLWTRNLRSLAQLYIWLGRLDEAEKKIQRMSELNPDLFEFLLLRARYYLARSDLPACLEELRRLEQVSEGQARKPIIRALILALSGKKEESRALLLPQWTMAEPSFHPFGWLIAWIYCELGDLDDCLRWLRQIDIAFQWIRLDPRLATVRNDPRFPDVLRAWNLL